MTQFRSPIIWRLILWFILLSLIPIAIVAVFIQKDIRAAFINLNLNELGRSASLFSESFMSQYNAGQAIDLGTKNKDESVLILTSDGKYFAHSSPEKTGQPASPDFSEITLNKILGTADITLEDRESELLIATVHLPVNNLIAVVTADSKVRAAPLDGISRSITIQLIFSLLVTSLAGGAAILTVLNPLEGLANFAGQIGLGNFDTQLDDTIYEGELAVLAQAFNSMARQLKNLISGLETRVAERTTDLDVLRKQSEKRAGELQTIGEISKTIAGEQNLEKLLPLIAVLVSERFGFYHTGIFLLDETDQFALLQAANSEGGKKMLDRGHRLEVGEGSLVGFAAKTGQPRVALDVGQDAVFFNNPDLPDTHSEIALPLRSGDEILGALDVQSAVTNAFTQEDVNTLSTLADQVAIAIQNAHSSQKGREALALAEAATMQLSRQQWQFFLTRKHAEGYYFDGIDVKDIRPADKQRTHSLAIPLTLRGAKIGSIKLSAPDPDRTWTDDEIAFVKAAAERTSLALESARLLQEAQNRAAKERTIGDISTKIGSAVNIDGIIETAVRELGRILPGAEVAIQFQNEQ